MSLEETLATFTPIDLEEIKRVALLDRFEVKYVLHRATLEALLPALCEEYAVLTIAGQQVNRYRTLYFDTQDFALYHRHHMGARNRYKVRSREYVETNTSFLEVKHKTNKARTVKHRVSTPELMTTLGNAAPFLVTTCPYDAEELVPRLWNKYSRITLVNQAQQERVTLDLDLRFTWRDQRVALPNVVIAEVKQPSRTCTSPFTQLLRTAHIRQTRFSKYCVGVSLLYPEIKHNNFREIHRLIAKLAKSN